MLIDLNEINNFIKPEIILNDWYKVIKIIGKGVFGVVIKAFDKKDLREVAIKIMQNSK